MNKLETVILIKTKCDDNEKMTKNKDEKNADGNEDEAVKGAAGAAGVRAQETLNTTSVTVASQTPVKKLKERHEALAAEVSSVVTRSRRERKVTDNEETGSVAGVAGVEADASDAGLTATPTASAPAAPPSKKKDPCGKCGEKVTLAGKSLSCQVCEFWFHYECVPGMTKEFFDNCKMTREFLGHSAFLCQVCRKVVAKFNRKMKDFEGEIKKLNERVNVLELEKESLAQKVENMEMKTDKVKEGLEGVEKEVVSGMEKAKEEVKQDMGREMKEREERSQNIVLYGLEEPTAQTTEERKKEEKRRVEEVVREIGVEANGEIEVKFRAGKKMEGETGTRPRPLIVHVSDEETRERIFKGARNLSRVPAMKKVFVSPDLTWTQREEARKEEKQLKELADKKTEEAKNEGKSGKWIMIGQRGKRRLVWTDRVQ